MQQKVEEKIDPLTRIQEEIKEVVRREEEYRQLVTLTSVSGGTPPVEVVEFETYTVQQDNGEEEQQQQDRGILVTAQPVVAVQTTSLLVPIDEHSNTPDSLASSVNSTKEESLDGQHSDDSGISASSNNNTNNNKSNNGQVAKQPLKLTIVGRQEQRYIGPNCYNLTPEPPQQKLKAHTTITSTPHQQQKRQFAFNGIATKGVMQRFIASHGKVQQLGGGVGLGGPVTPIGLSTPTLAINNNNNNNSTTIASNATSTTTLKLNSRTALAFLENGQTLGSNSNINVNNNNITISSPTAIERDSEGRPLRRGYVPVEQKIQRELQDLKSRETELKRQRKLNRQNTLKASLDKLQLSTDDEADGEEDDDEDDEDSEVEHCYGPGKLRNAQSTLELDRDCNDQDLAYKATGNRSLNAAVLSAANGNNNSNGSISVGLRPAMSLAQLCDLTPEEAPSSHRLIAQWESLIKKNAEGAAAPIEAII
ncbi:protein kinase 3 [Drosophila tropicalis]|uniref:protein kinase 3 n=1 Tax=Drosophila tropicalis TaxID=46794 RepID=UPI0035ABB73F